jgi:signal transduction histidine kinase
LRDVAVLEDRERIAADLRDKAIQRIFAAGLTLQGAAARAKEPDVRRQVEASVNDLDQAIWIIRDTIFNIEHRQQGRGLRTEIIHLCGGLSPMPEVTFSGPVDGALHPGLRAQLLDIFREALTVITQHATPARIGITADQNSYMTVIEAYPASPIELDRPDPAFLGLQDMAVQAGMRIDINPGPDFTRFAWRVPITST